MRCQQNSLVPIGEVIADLPGPVKAIRDASLQARLLALCSLPRTNPGKRYRYVRRNGPTSPLSGTVRSNSARSSSTKSSVNPVYTILFGADYIFTVDVIMKNNQRHTLHLSSLAEDSFRPCHEFHYLV